MATQRPSGNGGAQRASDTSRASRTQQPRPPRPPAKESTAVRDLGPDTVWHTRGLHGHTRLRAPLPRGARSPQRQLPPSRVPRLLLWGLLLVLLAVLANAVSRMTQ
ncbi:hypothetical protein [Cupriavidus basilensis]|uniref:hypothetical protein n=1 Tax=Cupriavidus basilensis TaxID=68895 RepID=UPI000750D74A|nr:hypothetical protein [Cupriavidus basilensis]